MYESLVYCCRLHDVSLLGIEVDFGFGVCMVYLSGVNDSICLVELIESSIG